MSSRFPLPPPVEPPPAESSPRSGGGGGDDTCGSLTSPRLYGDNDNDGGGGEVVTLNVGGVVYTTTRATLARHPDSMLGAMFGGRFRPTAARDRHGNYFIDRDGATFRHVLNFLRAARLCLPRGYADLDLLEAEADFYQIPALCVAVRELRTAADGDRPVAAPGRGRYLEMLDFEETAYFHRFYSDPPRGLPADLKNGGLVLTGERVVLLSLPLPDKTLADLGESTCRYRTVNVSGGSAAAVTAGGGVGGGGGGGACAKMAVIDELQANGWQLVTTSFSNSTDTDGSYIVHKYVWYLPV